MTTASIIIRTKNEEEGLGSTLDGVLRQTVRPHEILVIDSGSTDGTLGVARRYPTRVMSIPASDWSYPRALNLAAAQARGDILVCLSAHCPPVDDRWLANLLRHFDDPKVAAVWGPGRRPGRPAPNPEGPLRLEPGSYGVANRWWGPSNANCALRRRLWEEFPFDESLPATEDKAWAREAMERGYSVVHDPEAVVWHERHRPMAAFRRNRAVMDGFAMMFPELRGESRGRLAVAAVGVWRTARFHLRTRDPRVLWYDLRRIPTFIAAVLGDLVGTRGR